MPAAAPANVRTRKQAPRILVVDDEPGILEMARDLISAEVDCKLGVASSVAEARRAIDRNPVDLLIVDIHLPDGDGLELLNRLRQKHPTARAIVMTGSPTVDTSIESLRAGAIDFIAKPFTAADVARRIRSALFKQQTEARDLHRLTRLRDAVKRLNRARKTVSKKVDLLCNDLVHAYTDLAKQLESVRTEESFRSLLDSASDLEQLLCHAMDWLLRKAGYSNIAIYLVGDDQQYELGAYMKYTLAGEKQLTEALRDGLVQRLNRDQHIVAEGSELIDLLTPAEVAHLQGQTLMGTTCNYLGESLAVVVLFRDQKSPFSRDDAEMLKNIAPLFASALAGLVRRPEDDGSVDDPEFGDDEPIDDVGDTPWESDTPRNESRKPRRKQKDRTSDADWWKRGEPPPF